MSPKKRRGRLAAYVCTAAPLLRREMKWQFSVLKIHHRQCYSIENALQGLMHVGNFSTVHSAVVDTKTFFDEKTLFNTRYKTNSTQNGIWVKFQHFWPKNDDEKWSRKNIFEIPPCAHHVIFITKFVPFNQNSVIKMTW